MLEGVGMEMEEGETGQDLSVGIVCQKNYEEPGQRGSAADFLLRGEMEGKPPGKKVEAGALVHLEINDCNKCHCLLPSIASV